MKFLHTKNLELIINPFCATIDNSYELKLNMHINSVPVTRFYSFYKL